MTFYFGFPFVLLYFAQSAASVYRTKSKNVNLSILSTCFFNVILKRNEKERNCSQLEHPQFSKLSNRIHSV